MKEKIVKEQTHTPTAMRQQAEKGINVKVIACKCRLCKNKIYGKDEADLQKNLNNHIDNECSTAKLLLSWEKDGTYKENMKFYRSIGLEKSLKRLMKKTKATPKELIDILNDLIIDEGLNPR